MVYTYAFVINGFLTAERIFPPRLKKGLFFYWYFNKCKLLFNATNIRNHVSFEREDYN